MRTFEIVVCDRCARELGDGAVIAIGTDARIDHPGAAVCEHVLARLGRNVLGAPVRMPTV